MPQASRSDNVRKICGCAKWKVCTHPWYIFYRSGKKISDKKPGMVVENGLRCKLSTLVGCEPRDFAEAKAEARRAIVAWKDGRDARELLPGDRPTLAAMLDAYPSATRRDVAACRDQIRPILRTVVNGRAFGEWHVDEITREMLEAFRRKRPRVAGNRDLGLLRAAFNWAVLAGLVTATPFKVGTVAAVKLGREDPRSRRLQGDEAERLMLAAGGLADVITGALETGCRRGELLSLQWAHVRFAPRAEIFLVAAHTKTKRDRRIPMSTLLRAVLERRRLDPAGQVLPPDAYVFGDEIGRPRQSVKTAWKGVLTRAKIRDLHFHDLRREAGSRWMDAGIPLATIQRWLGHANIAQTSSYLGASLGADEHDMYAYEAKIGRVHPLPQIAVFDGPTGADEAASNIGPTEKTQQNRIVH
jgi:integrase